MLLTKHEDQVFADQTIFATGQAFIRCQFVRCSVVVTGNPLILEGCSFNSCNFRLECDLLWGDDSNRKLVRALLDLMDTGSAQ
jgi:hypothetical protein